MQTRLITLALLAAALALPACGRSDGSTTRPSTTQPSPETQPDDETETPTSSPDIQPLRPAQLGQLLPATLAGQTQLAGSLQTFRNLSGVPCARATYGGQTPILLEINDELALPPAARTRLASLGWRPITVAGRQAFEFRDTTTKTSWIRLRVAGRYHIILKAVSEPPRDLKPAAASLPFATLETMKRASGNSPD